MTGSFDITELDRRLSNVVRLGTVIETRLGNPPEARVRLGEVESGWLRMGSMRAGGDRAWWPYEVGEEVVVLAPSGQLAGGVIVAALYNGANQAPGTGGDLARAVFGDGLTIEHDRAAKRTVISALESEGTILIQAKNLILRTGEDGYYHLDHAGRASRITHKGGADYESETWVEGSQVTPLPDQGFTPPAVHTDEEAP